MAAFAGIRERISLYVFILFHTLPKAEEASEPSEPQVCARPSRMLRRRGTVEHE